MSCENVFEMMKLLSVTDGTVFSGLTANACRAGAARYARIAQPAHAVALPRGVGATECVDPLPKYRRGTALPCFPLIDDSLPRGTHPGRELRLTQA